MIIIDEALRNLEKEKKPIKVGLIGAGFAARGFASQLLEGVPGIKLAAVCNRTISYAEQAFTDMDIHNYEIINEKSKFDNAIKNEKYIITQDYKLICENPAIDVVVEATGSLEYGAKVVMKAIRNKKHVVLINAELDTTIGPILKKYAELEGVVYTQADGDQPAVLMNLLRYVETIGFKPKVLGNIKSLLDNKRTPATQEAWSAAHYQRPIMPTSFADGTKISYEMATLANATGFGVGTRNMYGPKCDRVENAPKVFTDEMIGNGIVDYILGAEPSFGVFILATTENPVKKRYMKIYKMGEGPLYTFYVPYHLSPLEAPISVARAVLFKDFALKPLRPVCDVVAVAKKRLKKGEILDGVGGFCCYGEIENVKTIQEENLITMGFIEGCKLKRNIPIDRPLTYEDVIIPEGRLIDKLKREQDEYFGYTNYRSNKPDITIGIPTCYGGESLIMTAKSLLQSKGDLNLEIIIQSDRNRIPLHVKNKLTKMGVKVFWNPKEGSQFKKLKQIINKANGEFFIFTQDDIVFDPNALNEIYKTFKSDPAVTMLGARVLPLNSENFIESSLASMVRIIDNTGRHWNNGDNHLMASGRCMAFRTKFLKKYRIPEKVVTGDAYLYMENKRLNGKFTYTPKGIVYIRCPQNIKDQLGPSSRYQFSEKELIRYYNNVEQEYKIPLSLIVLSFIKEFTSHPLSAIFYLGIYLYSRLHSVPAAILENPVWKVDLSTKNVLTNR